MKDRATSIPATSSITIKELSLINPATTETYTMPPEMESGTSKITTAYGSFDYPTYTKKTT